MKYIYPDYYKEFKCIASKCRHNCCIGWEIDIDSDSAGYYGSIQGQFGERLSESIEYGENPHFILGEHERCPFLNKDNLCDIILTLGEDALCDICTEHPRFYNETEIGIEAGVGLCCEAAARLVLGRVEPMKLCGDVTDAEQDEQLRLRNRLIDILGQRDKTIDARLGEIMELCGAEPLQIDIAECADMFLSLERLDDDWTRVLEFLKCRNEDADVSAFEKYMSERETEYENLAVYFIYRHFICATSKEEQVLRAGFAALAVILLRAIGAAIYACERSFSFEQQTELARMFSSEVEYSEENMEDVFDFLSEKLICYI